MHRCWLVSVFVLASSIGALAQPAAPLPEQVRAQKPSRIANPHLDSQLAQLVQRLTRTNAAQLAASVRNGRGDAVPVAIRFDGLGDALVSTLRQLGVTPANTDDGVVEAYVPITLLMQVAAIRSVVKVQLIVPPVPKMISQGVAAHHADTWQAGGRTGSGVKVGIIDVGFLGFMSLMGTELPASVTARCFTTMGLYTSNPSDCDRDTEHGAAVAETLVDVAPGVQLYIANPISPLDVRNTVQWMTSQGVKVINHSVGWNWMGPGDGTSPYSDAPVYSVDLAVAGGAMWANSAGNEGQATWSGSFTDPDANGLLNFSGGVEANAVYLRAGFIYYAQLRWEASWTAAARDLDLYLCNTPVLTACVPVAASATEQSGMPGDTPYELLSYAPTTDGVYYLVVHHYSGSLPGWVQVQSFTGEPLQYFTAGRSIGNPAESANPGLLAAGAAPWWITTTIEPYSSQGPTRDGRTKPDLVGADRGDTVTYGPYFPSGDGFAGTSQASPHIAGLAALVLGEFPNTPPTQLAAYLKAVASPRGDANTWGAGFAQVPIFPNTISLSAFLPDKTFPAATGQPITWRAFAIGSAAPFEYKFLVYREGLGWSVGQNYSTSNTFAWNPPAQGNYSLQVWARHVGSIAEWEDWKSSGGFQITGPAPVTVTSFTTNVSFPASWGTPITFTATATGGIAPLQYQFWRLRQGVGWSLAQDYSSSNSYTWTPGVSDGGTYSMQVWVKSTGSAAAYEAWTAINSFVIIGVPPVTVTSFNASVTFPSPAYVPITWTAIAVGGSGPLMYQFWRLKQGAGWSLVQDYSTRNTYSWTPVAADVGTYVLQVWVRSSGSTAAYEAWSGTGSFAITSPPPVHITTFSSSPAPPVTIGTPITWTAAASGGAPPVQFKFYLLDVDANTWSVLQDYSVLASVTWTPIKAGTYLVQVWARSATSAAAYDDWRSSGYFVIQSSATPVVAALTANVAFPAMVTNPMTWTAVAAGGAGPLEYKFWRYRQGAGWLLAQDYGPSPLYTWTPSATDEGTYHIQVWVRTAGSSAAYEAWRNSEEFRVVPSIVLRLVGQPGNSVGGSTETVLTPSDVTFTPTRNYDNGVSIQATNFTAGQSIFWYLDFAAAGGAPLAPGIYAPATRFPFQSSTEPGLAISGNGLGCNTLWGRFIVLAAQYDAGGAVLQFAADFEQHCDGSAAALFGSIRYNSAVPLVPLEDLTFSGTMPGRIGVPLAWSATTAVGLEYQFWRYSQTTHQWILAQGYSTNPTLTWTPQSSDEGEWAVEVWQRPVGSSVPYQGWRSSGAFSISP